jgi:hypothetical protein
MKLVAREIRKNTRIRAAVAVLWPVGNMQFDVKARCFKASSVRAVRRALRRKQ